MPEECDYCWRPPVAMIRLQQTWWRELFGFPSRQRYVCMDHVPREKRPGGRYA